MENPFNIFILLANHSNSIQLNKNIFETNIINLLLLITLLVYIGKDFLKSTLTVRQRSILDKIEEADKKVNEANKRFFETRKKWSQIDILTDNLEKQTLEKINSFHKVKSFKNKDLILKEYFSTIVNLNLKNEQIENQLLNYILELSLIEVYGIFNTLIENTSFQEDYLNYNVLLLKKLIGENKNK